MTSILTRSRKTVAAMLLVGSLLLLSIAGGIVYTLAGSNPGIAGIVPQNFVASFLGIQPQSLSRIKRQMKAKVATV